MNYVILICIFFWSHITECEANNVVFKKTKKKTKEYAPCAVGNKNKKDMEVYWTGFLSKYHRLV